MDNPSSYALWGEWKERINEMRGSGKKNRTEWEEDLQDGQKGEKACLNETLSIIYFYVIYNYDRSRKISWSRDTLYIIFNNIHVK